MKNYKKFHCLLTLRFFLLLCFCTSITKVAFTQENVYGLLGKVTEAKNYFVRAGNYKPSKEELAAHVGITVEKLDKLQFMSRIPQSLQQTVWADQDTTFQVSFTFSLEF